MVHIQGSNPKLFPTTADFLKPLSPRIQGLYTQIFLPVLRDLEANFVKSSCSLNKPAPRAFPWGMVFADVIRLGSSFAFLRRAVKSQQSLRGLTCATSLFPLHPLDLWHYFSLPSFSVLNLVSLHLLLWCNGSRCFCRVFQMGICERFRPFLFEFVLFAVIQKEAILQ